VHALSRQAPDLDDEPVTLEGVGIICHAFDPQIGEGYVKSFSLTRNPVDHQGSPTPFVEEGRAHLEVSLLIGVRGEGVASANEEELAELTTSLAERLQTQRLAGGTVVPISPKNKLELVQAGSTEKRLKKLKRRLMPGFALVERSDRLHQQLLELQEHAPQATALDALLDASALHWDCVVEGAEDGKQTVDWRVRPRSGWVVPLPVGYRAISPLYAAGEVLNARDKETPFRFVESLYSLGEWVSPHRVQELDQFLWHHQAEPETGIYRCINHYTFKEIDHV
jgi:CRISPR-associated protein Csy2